MLGSSPTVSRCLTFLSGCSFSGPGCSSSACGRDPWRLIGRWMRGGAAASNPDGQCLPLPVPAPHLFNEFVFQLWRRFFAFIYLVAVYLAEEETTWPKRRLSAHHLATASLPLPSHLFRIAFVGKRKQQRFQYVTSDVLPSTSV